MLLPELPSGRILVVLSPPLAAAPASFMHRSRSAPVIPAQCAAAELAPPVADEPLPAVPFEVPPLMAGGVPPMLLPELPAGRALVSLWRGLEARLA